MLPNDRVYALRLQHRIGFSNSWTDLLDEQGSPVEYVRNPLPGHAERFGSLQLPAELAGQEYILLRWRYSHRSGNDGPRAQLRLDDIRVATHPVGPRDPILVWPEPQPITYGTPLGADQLNAMADVPGTFFYRPPAGTWLPVGAHPINVTFTPDDHLVYATATAQVELKVLHAPPGITRQPASQIVLRGKALTFTVEVDGVESLTHQWLLDGEPISAATEPMLAIENAQPADAGIYRLTVTNPGGSVTTQPAHLTVVGLRLHTNSSSAWPRILIAGPVGNRYQIDSTSALLSPMSWDPGIPFLLDHPVVEFIDDSPSATTHRFYRVIHLTDP